MQDIIGRARTFDDSMDPARARALAILLGAAPPPVGEPLPPFFHQAYFWDAVPRSALGRDGHPATGAFIPDLGLPRRMWAGGNLVFHHPLRAGLPARKTSTITKVVHKDGHTGRLAFVTIRHEIAQEGAVCVIEDQDLVFREDHDPDAPTPRVTPAPADTAPETHEFDPAFLFRYSALTFNGHRIHYDAAYATGVEGYGGIVTHGPLLAQLMMLRASRQGTLSAFQFRAVRPLLVTERATICMKDQTIWVRNDRHALNMKGEAQWH